MLLGCHATQKDANGSLMQSVYLVKQMIIALGDAYNSLPSHSVVLFSSGLRSIQIRLQSQRLRGSLGGEERGEA